LLTFGPFSSAADHMINNQLAWAAALDSYL
jgi:hypothetical protein